MNTMICGCTYEKAPVPELEVDVSATIEGVEITATMHDRPVRGPEGHRLVCRTAAEAVEAGWLVLVDEGVGRHEERFHA